MRLLSRRSSQTTSVVFFFLLFFFLPFLFPVASRADEPDTGRATLSTAIKKVSTILSKSGLSKIPSASQALSSKTSSSKATSQAVSGTPPLLSQIPNVDVKTLFWRPNVVETVANGSPNQQQCAEFFSSPVDGNSGGLGACHMAEALGRSFQTTLDAETSLCYIKNFPTAANLNAGGITVNSGAVTAKNISKLFLAGTKARTIKINAPQFRSRGQAETIFVRIPSAAANEKAGRLYRADLYFCPPGQQGPRGYNIIQISDKGVMKINVGNRSDPFNGGANTIELKGTVKTASGSIVWDPTKSRILEIRVEKDDDVSKGHFEILKQGMVTLKRRDAFNNSTLKEYILSHFSGDDALSALILEGAFKSDTQRNSNTRSFTGATEFRDTLYAAAPDNSLKQKASDYEISSDSFYDADADVNVDTSAYSCSANGSVELTMNSGNSTLETALSTCFTTRLQGQGFCRDDELVRRAEDNFDQKCANNQQPPP